MDGQENLERTRKAREKSGNLKINGYGGQSSENSFTMYSVQEGKGCTCSRDSLSPSPSPLGATLIVSLKSNPQI